MSRCAACGVELRCLNCAAPAGPEATTPARHDAQCERNATICYCAARRSIMGDMWKVADERERGEQPDEAASGRGRHTGGVDDQHTPSDTRQAPSKESGDPKPQPVAPAALGSPMCECGHLASAHRSGELYCDAVCSCLRFTPAGAAAQEPTDEVRDEDLLDDFESELDRPHGNPNAARLMVVGRFRWLRAQLAEARREREEYSERLDAFEDAVRENLPEVTADADGNLEANEIVRIETTGYLYKQLERELAREREAREAAEQERDEALNDARKERQRHARS